MTWIDQENKNSEEMRLKETEENEGERPVDEEFKHKEKLFLSTE